MKVTDFDFELPDELIARFPMPERSQSRLFCVQEETPSQRHRVFKQLTELLRPDDVLVMNDTRVLPARLFGQKSTGGQIELLVERVLGEYEVLVHLRASKSPKPGSTLLFAEGVQAEMLARAEDLFHLRFSQPVLSVLYAQGEMPLPPYMSRDVQHSDQERYQTVYAHPDKAASAAAPTAGLHFDDGLLSEIRAMGVTLATVTLHVGAGTFRPVRVDDIRDHQMHSEWLSVSEETVAAIQSAKARGGRVIAVGTTSVRALESAAQALGHLGAYEGNTQIFIYPGYEWQVVDGLITNFHLPQSTLLMLVSAFAGYETIRAAYAEAIREQYRFFSYGDAMFLLRA